MKKKNLRNQLALLLAIVLAVNSCSVGVTVAYATEITESGVEDTGAAGAGSASEDSETQNDRSGISASTETDIEIELDDESDTESTVSSEASEDDVFEDTAGWTVASSHPTSGSCGDSLTWTFDTQTGTLTISGDGDMEDYSLWGPWGKYYNDEILKIVIEDGVTSIGDYAFWYCKNLEEVSIGKDVTRVGKSAFASCAMESITLPDSVTEIGAWAFYPCVNLKTVSLGSGVSSIGEYAFYTTSGQEMEEILVSEDNAVYTSVDGVLFSKDMTELIRYPNGKDGESYEIPSGVESIGDDAFYYCTKLSSVTIPDSVTVIGEDAFYLCSSLTEVILGEGITEIGAWAFRGVNCFTELTLPDSLKIIGNSAFAGNDSLTTVNIGSGVINMGDENPFRQCSSLITIYVSSENVYYYTDEDGVLYDKNNVLICYPEGKTDSDYTVPEGTTTIGDMAFASWEGQDDHLVSVTLPDSVTTIGYGAFMYCQTLEEVSLGDGLKYIGDFAFNECTALKSADLPESLTGIGEKAFYHTALSQVSLGSNIRSISKYGAFGACDSLKAITVSTKNAYFCAEDGILFNVDKTILYQYPAGKTDDSYTVPNSVSEICGYAFTGNDYLTSVTGTAWLRETDGIYVAFEECGSLTELVLPKGIYISTYGTQVGSNITRIEPAKAVSLSDCVITLSSTSYTYDGVAKKPTVTVKNGTVVLREGWDYCVSYSNNKNAGTASVVITGLGDYCSGTATKTFTIKKASQTLTASLSQSSIEVGNTATVSASGIGTITYSSSNTSVASVNSSGTITGKVAGTATITVKAAGNANYNSASKTLSVTVTSTAITSDVSLDTLTYSFSNSSSSFGYSSTYRIPLARYKMFYSDQQAATYYRDDGYWGGSCFGMSSTSSMFNSSGSGLTINSFNSSASKVSNLAVSNSNSTLGLTVTQLIEAMQVSQYTSAVQETYRNNSSLTDLCSEVEAVASGGAPPIIAVWSTNGGHALLGYAIEKISSTCTYLYVYDCNYPNTERYITLTTNSSGAYTGWYYKINDKYNCGSNYSGTKIRYTPYRVFQSVWEGRNATTNSMVNELCVASDSFEIRSAEGETLAVMTEDGFDSMSDDIYEVMLVDTVEDGSGSHLICMPLEFYTILDTGKDDTEEFEFTMVNEDQSVTVSTQADSVSVFVDDEQAASIVEIDGNCGELYEVTVSSSLEDYSDGQETVTYCGRCSGDDITVGTSYSEFVADNYGGSGVAVEDAIVNCTDSGESVKDISYFTLTLSDDMFPCTGERVEPEVIITDDDSNTLVNGVDYTLVYENNIEKGTASVTAYGINEYTGKLSGSFTIVSGVQTVTVSAENTSLIKGKTTTVTATTTGDGTISYSSSNSSVASVDANGKITAKGYGTAVITAKASETENYAEGSATLTISVQLATPTLSSASNTSSGVKISWGAVSGAEKYMVFRRKSGSSSWTRLATVTATSYTDSTVSGGNTYDYTVRCVTAGSTASSAVFTSDYDRTGISIFRLAAGTISSLTNNSTGITVKWSKVSGASGYYIYRKTGSGSYSKIKTITSGSTVTYTDTSVSSGTTYYYKVYAYASTGTSSASAVKSISRLSSVKISSLTNTSTGVTVKWSKASGASGYYIYRKTGSGSYSKIKTITSGSTVTYTDTSVSSGKTYYYKVYAYASTGTSAASSAKSIRFLTAGKISSLTNTSGGITVKWSKVSGASGYYVYRKTGSGSYSKVKTVTSRSKVSYSDTAVKSKNGTTYTYYVIPYYKNSSGTVTKGSHSNTKKMVRMTAVSLSSVKNSSSKKMTVKWTKNSKATGYQIQYSTSSSFASGNKTVTVSGASSYSKVISSLTRNKTYYVRVRSYKTVSGTKYYSAWSSKKSVKISK